MNEVIIKNVSVSLDWNDVSAATKYHCQISRYVDFSSPVYNVDTLLTSQTSHTLTTGEGKYFWRWRPYVSGAWQPWKEYSSFFYDSSASTAISAIGWKFINKNDVTDSYEFTLPFRSWEYPDEHLFRTKTRNRSGKILDEWYATKSSVELDISRSYLGPDEKAEIQRFYNFHSPFYLVTRLDNQTETDFVFRIWEVLFSKAPQLDKPGGNLLVFEEV